MAAPATHLQVAFQEPLDELVGRVLPQAGGEVFQLVQEAIQILPKLLREKP